MWCKGEVIGLAGMEGSGQSLFCVQFLEWYELLAVM